jgi:hypothetical protein
VDTGAQIADFKRVVRYTPGTACLVPECGRTDLAGRGLCDKHHQAWRKGRDIGVSVPTYGLDAAPRIVPPPKLGRPKRKNKWVGKDGYALVTAPADHPHARQDGSILEHRLVMEQHLGRFLEEWELVHHKNGNRQDNQVSNLELLDGRAKNGGPGHPPGHNFDTRTAAQVLLQQNDLPEDTRRQIENYLTSRLTLVV